jgi:hypothetical protein
MSTITPLPRHYPETILELLAQADVWQDDHEGVGVWRPIEGMPLGRALRILGGLELAAGRIALKQVVENEAELEDLAGLMTPRHEVVAAETDVDRRNAELLATPASWLRTRPFYVAVLREVTQCLDLVPRWRPPVVARLSGSGWISDAADRAAERLRVAYRDDEDRLDVTTPGELAAKREG